MGHGKENAFKFVKIDSPLAALLKLTSSRVIESNLMTANSIKRNIWNLDIIFLSDILEIKLNFLELSNTQIASNRQMLLT